jgi:hypothetical protein
MAKSTGRKKLSRVRYPGMDVNAHLQNAALDSFWSAIFLLYLAGKAISKASKCCSMGGKHVIRVESYQVAAHRFEGLGSGR